MSIGNVDMKIKALTYCIASFVVAFLLCGKLASASESQEQVLVRNFYTWYCNALLMHKGALPEFDQKIFSFVHGCTVKRIRTDYERGIISDNYFIKGNDYWPELFENITVHEAVPINSTVSVVPVRFQVSEKKNHIIIVFVEKENSKYYIIKVEDTVK